MFKQRYKAIISICLLAGSFACLAPSGLSQVYGQNGVPPGAAPTLGQSDWQTLNSGSNQQYQPVGQPLGQSDWQNPGGNAPNYNQAPGLNGNSAGNASNMMQPQAGGAMPNVGQNPWQNANAGMNQYQPGNQPLGQSGWQNPAPNAGSGLSPWQQQNSVQTNINQNPNAPPQQNPDYYYGQVNQNQPNQQNPYAFNNGQYQGQANYSAQPNNQWSSNLPPASSIPPQQTQAQNPQGGGLKKTLADITKAAAQAAGMGMGVAAPLAGAYMMSKAMTPTVPTYGMPTMPYGYGYPGMAMPTMYAAPNYGMMNMAPMYASAFSGLSSFMTH